MLSLMFQQLFNGVVKGSTYALFAAGMALIFGVMNLPNFSHGQLFMLAGFFVFFIFSQGVNPLIAMVLGIFSFIGVGVLLRKTVFFNVRYMTLMERILVNMGLATSIEGLCLIIWGPNYRKIPSIVTGSFSMGGVIVPYERLLVIIVAVITIIGLYFIVFKSKIGRAMRATQQNKDAAETLGVNIERIYTITYTLGIFVTSIGAALLLPVFYLDPYMGSPITTKAFAITIFGGMGSIKGAIICGLILGIVEALGGLIIPYKYIDLISYLLMISIVIFKPTGLFGRY